MRSFSIFAILDSRNYRLFFVGQLISLVGLWMTNTASMWLVYHLSKSPFLLGIAGFCAMAPDDFGGTLCRRVG